MMDHLLNGLYELLLEGGVEAISADCLYLLREGSYELLVQVLASLHPLTFLRLSGWGNKPVQHSQNK
jgi:hypothetical protein